MTMTQENLGTTLNNKGEVVPMLNVDLILKLIGWAEQDEKWMNALEFLHETDWDQGVWGRFTEPAVGRAFMSEFVKDVNVCGTAHCMAGGAVVESDYRLLYSKGATGPAEECIPIQWTGRYDENGKKVYSDVKDAPRESISDAGQRILGLTDREADLYFEGSNAIDDLKGWANHFAQDRGMPALFFGADGVPVGGAFDPNAYDPVDDEDDNF